MSVENLTACPVCFFPEKPHDFEICPCCGTQFCYHDAGRSHAELREEWIATGMRWWSPAQPMPEGWDAEKQLATVRPTRPDGFYWVLADRWMVAEWSNGMGYWAVPTWRDEFWGDSEFSQIVEQPLEEPCFGQMICAHR